MGLRRDEPRPTEQPHVRRRRRADGARRVRAVARAAGRRSTISSTGSSAPSASSPRSTSATPPSTRRCPTRRSEGQLARLRLARAPRPRRSRAASENRGRARGAPSPRRTACARRHARACRPISRASARRRSTVARARWSRPPRRSSPTASSTASRIRVMPLGDRPEIRFSSSDGSTRAARSASARARRSHVDLTVCASTERTARRAGRDSNWALACKAQSPRRPARTRMTRGRTTSYRQASAQSCGSAARRTADCGVLREAKQ